MLTFFSGNDSCSRSLLFRFFFGGRLHKTWLFVQGFTSWLLNQIDWRVFMREQDRIFLLRFFVDTPVRSQDAVEGPQFTASCGDWGAELRTVVARCAVNEALVDGWTACRLCGSRCLVPPFGAWIVNHQSYRTIGTQKIVSFRRYQKKKALGDYLVGSEFYSIT